MGAILLLRRCELQREEERQISRGQIKKFLYSNACNSNMGGEKTQKNFKEEKAIHRFAVWTNEPGCSVSDITTSNKHEDRKAR